MRKHLSQPVEVARYRLPLTRPFRVGDVELAVREGALIRLRGVDGGIGYGDLCPLPGLSGETLDEALGALRSVDSHRWPPSLSWAMREAARDLADADGARAQVETAALLRFPDEPPVGAAAVKLKVGRVNEDDELRWVERVAASFGGELRLDGNGALSLPAARRFAAAAGARLGFFEEPVAADFLSAAIADLPVALDETLLRSVGASGDAPRGAVAWVVKPVVCGPARCDALVGEARARGVRVIISSVFESAVGRAGLARLAAEVAPDEVHGLGTSGALREDVDVEQLDTLAWVSV